jgi:dienelactone hydrolase
MATETFNYQADGLDMVGRLALPDGAAGPRPAVLVFPHAFGPGDHSLGKAERLAKELGYVALECDLYGGAATATMDQIGERMKPMRESAETVRARTVGALKALLARPEVDGSRIAAMGFCFGGTMAYELALTGAELKAAIGFHSGLTVTSPGDAAAITGKVLTMVGADDPAVPAEARAGFMKMLADAKVDYTMTVYGGVVHSFTDPNADTLGRPDFARYDANADRRSWAQMAELLAEVFEAD